MRNYSSLNVTDDNFQQESVTKTQTEQKGKLMKDMGQLWLKAEVRELETKVKRTSALPPYLVLDSDALTYHTNLVKQLMHSKKFIMLVPSIGMNKFYVKLLLFYGI